MLQLQDIKRLLGCGAVQNELYLRGVHVCSHEAEDHAVIAHPCMVSVSICAGIRAEESAKRVVI